MTNRLHSIAWTMAALAVGLLALQSCGAAGQLAPPDDRPSAAELQARLAQVLHELGKDITHTPARAPSQGSAVFDLVVVPGANANTLSWTERLVGDYDYNGVVNIGELTPLGAMFMAGLEYADPLLHDGITWWPAGEPEQDNNASLAERPAEGSGAYNWWLSRVDGDANGLLNLADLTPIGAHWGERLDGYHVYRKAPGESDYSQVLDPDNGNLPLLIPRSSAGPRAGQTGWTPTRPVRCQFVDETATGPGYSYRVAAYDSVSGQEGPLSIAGASPIAAALTATPAIGAAPLEVQFDASGGSSEAGDIVSYSWDFENDGVVDVLDSAVPTAAHTYTLNGRYTAALTLVDSAGNALTVGTTISVTEVPVAVIHALPSDGEVPVTVRYDASASFDPDGQVVSYEWDLDGDGSFETNTGPVSYRDIAYSAVGSTHVGLRVSDNFGASAVQYYDLTLVDRYDEREPNDIFMQPNDLGELGVGVDISGMRGSLGATGYDGDDEDWYSVTVTSGGRLSIDLDFLNTDADLSLRLFNATGATEYDSSLGSTDGEHISFGVLGSGTYLIEVQRNVASFGEHADYHLSLHLAALTYGEVEENDSRTSATDLAILADPGLPSIFGSLGSGGYDGDSIDWFRVNLPQAAQLTTRLRFFHHDADLDLAVYGGNGSELMGESLSIDDDEEVTFDAAPGTYFIRCTRHQGGSANYNLGFILQ